MCCILAAGKMESTWSHLKKFWMVTGVLCKSGKKKDVNLKWISTDVCVLIYCMCAPSAGTRVTSERLWCLVGWTAMGRTCTASTPTAPLTSCPTSPWVRPTRTHTHTHTHCAGGPTLAFGLHVGPSLHWSSSSTSRQSLANSLKMELSKVSC